jgi:hypothetical protein
MVPTTPQQQWWEWWMSQLDPRKIEIGRAEGLRNQQAQANRQTAVTGDPIIPPPMATGEQGYVAPVPPRESLISPITPVGGAPGSPGSSLAGPPAPVSAFGPSGPGGVLPPLDRDRALAPLTTPNSMTPTPPAMLGGNNYTAGPSGMSGTEEQDALRRAGSASASAGSSGGGASSIGGLGNISGPLPINEAAAMRLYEDESGMGLRQGFADAGIDSFKNPYAMSAVRRYAPILPQLMEFFALASGQNLDDTASMATWVPQFIKGFMSGEINPQRLVQRAIELAADPANANLKEYLLHSLGPNALFKLQGDVSGYGPRLEGARQRVLQEQISRQQMAGLRNPSDPTLQEEEWLNIVRRGGR